MTDTLTKLHLAQLEEATLLRGFKETLLFTDWFNHFIS